MVNGVQILEYERFFSFLNEYALLFFLSWIILIGALVASVLGGANVEAGASFLGNHFCHAHMLGVSLQFTKIGSGCCEEVTWPIIQDTKGTPSPPSPHSKQNNKKTCERHWSV